MLITVCILVGRNSVKASVCTKHINLTSFNTWFLCFSGHFLNIIIILPPYFIVLIKPKNYLNCFLLDALSFTIFSFRWSLYVWISPCHLVTVPFSHTQICSATCKIREYTLCSNKIPTNRGRNLLFATLTKCLYCYGIIRFPKIRVRLKKSKCTEILYFSLWQKPHRYFSNIISC